VRKSNLDETSYFNRPTIFDAVLVGLIVLFSIGIMVHTGFGLDRKSPNVLEASIYHEGELLNRLKLDRDQEVKLLDGKMLVEVREKRIRVEKSECPRQICVNTGWIRYPGESIVCVPFKILIEITPTVSPTVDAVVF
jgi:hypothetical protein